MLQARNSASVRSGKKDTKGAAKRAGLQEDKTASLDTSKRGLHLCLKKLKSAKDLKEVQRLTDQLQRILFHRQYENAKT